jgi:serine phosphatase RsbU (regulator of sigma subunit)
LVAAQARGYVVDAVEESLAAERRERELADIERDLSIARDIQRSLMPSQAPIMPGYDIAGMARSAQQTGGDYYDWQQLPDGRLLVVLADVTGHGIGPALVMAVCRAYARATAPLAGDAADLLTRLNALMCADLASSGRFITMVIAVLSPDGKVEIISAGHGPTLLHQTATGKVEAFHGDGIPLGIDDGERYLSVNTRQLQPGDALLLVTDGFFEWPKAGHEMFGVERLEETFRQGANLSAAQMLEHLDAAAHAFAEGAPQADDTTAVAIRRL